jgi:hypothetical protein
LFGGFAMEEMMEYEYNAHINKQQQHQQKEQQQTQMSVSDVHQRRRPKKKPLSIHDAAQAGDVKSLQSKLEEDTGLINSRNPIVSLLSLGVEEKLTSVV